MSYAKKYDVFGEHNVKVEKGVVVHTYPDGDEVEERISHNESHQALIMLWLVSKDLDKKGRVVPLTTAEAERIVRAKLIKRLEGSGHVVKRLISMHTKQSEGKNVGSRSCMCFTDKGRRYVRGVLDAQVPSTTEQPGSDSFGSLARYDESADSHPV